MLAGRLPSRPRVVSPRWQFERATSSGPLRRRLEPWFRPLALVFRQPPTRPTPVVIRAGDQVAVTVAPRFHLSVRLFNQLRLLVARSTPIIVSPGTTGGTEIPVRAPSAWPGGPVIGRSGRRLGPVDRSAITGLGASSERRVALLRWPSEVGRAALSPVARRLTLDHQATERAGQAGAPPPHRAVAIGERRGEGSGRVPVRSPERAPDRGRLHHGQLVGHRRPVIGRSGVGRRPVDRSAIFGLGASSERRVALLRWPSEVGRAALVPVARRLTLDHQATERAGQAGAPTRHQVAIGERRGEGSGRVPVRSPERAPDRGTLHHGQPIGRRRLVSDQLPAPTAFRLGMPSFGPSRALARLAPPGSPVGAGLRAGGSVARARSTVEGRRRGLGLEGTRHWHRDRPATVRLSSDVELGNDRWAGGWPEPRWRAVAGRPFDAGPRVAGPGPAGSAGAPTGPLPAGRVLDPSGVQQRAMSDGDQRWTTGVDQTDGPAPGRLGRRKLVLGQSLRPGFSAAEPQRLGRVTALAEPLPTRASDRRPGSDVGFVARFDRNTGRESMRPTAPVENVFRRTADPGSTRPEPLTPTRLPPSPAPQPIDIDRLDRDLWERFEKRIQVERQRRGRA
jgi:hypothetical protein